MSPEVRERIFEPFFTTKDDSISTGLGLSVVQKVIDESNGTISVASKERKGTKIRILFPEVRDSD